MLGNQSMCFVFYHFPNSRSCPNCRIWSSVAYFPVFTVRYGLKKKTLWMWCLKQFIDSSFIRGMVENYCTLGKMQPLPSWPRLNFKLGTIIFHHSPHELSIFVYYYTEFNLRFLKTRVLFIYLFIYYFLFLCFIFILFYLFIYLFIYFLAVEPIVFSENTTLWRVSSNWSGNTVVN